MAPYGVRSFTGRTQIFKSSVTFSGADADFVLKKNKKKVKEMKRMQKLEEEAVKDRIKEEEDRQKENEREKDKKKKGREKERDKDRDRDKERRDAKHRYLDKYRDCSSKVGLRANFRGDRSVLTVQVNAFR